MPGIFASGGSNPTTTLDREILTIGTTAIDLRTRSLAGAPINTTAITTTNDWVPVAPRRNSYIFYPTVGDHTVTGIIAGVDGEELTLLNDGAKNLVLSNLNPLSATANQVRTGIGRDLVIPPNNIVVLKYDAFQSKWKTVSTSPGINVDRTIIAVDLPDPNTAGAVFVPAQPADTDAIYRSPDGSLWTYDGTLYVQSAAKVAPTRVSPNDGGGGNIPSGTDVFVLADGNFANPITLPVIDKNSRTLCIYSTASLDAGLATTRQIAGATARLITKDAPLWLIPTDAGWRLVNDTIIDYAGAVAYALSPIDRTIRFAASAPLSGINLYNPIKTPGFTFVLSNFSQFTQPINNFAVTGLYGGAVAGIPFGRSYTIQSRGGSWVVIDQGGQPSIVNVATSGTNYAIAPTDETIAFTGVFAGTQPIGVPSATAFIGRQFTLRFPADFSSSFLLTSGGGTIETLGTTQSTTATLQSASVSAATWQSDGYNWRLLNWVDRAFFATTNYTTPNNGIVDYNYLLANGSVAPAAGTAFQIPDGYLGYSVADGNYTPLIALPIGTTPTGWFSVWIGNNAAGFPTQIASTGTDLPATTTYNTVSSIHFKRVGAIWEWRSAPEPILSKHVAASGFPAPANTPTYNSLIAAGATAPVGALPFQVPNGVSSFVAADGNFTPFIKLPLLPTALGTFVVYTQNSPGPLTKIDRTGTDFLTHRSYQGGAGLAVFFEWDGTKWVWVPYPKSSAISGSTRVKTRGTYAAPLTGAVTLQPDDYLLYLAPSATLTLGAATFEREIKFKKPGAGSATLIGPIDGVANAVISGIDEAGTLTGDGATWGRS
jgi:hypothetical protein